MNYTRKCKWIARNPGRRQGYSNLSWFPTQYVTLSNPQHVAIPLPQSRCFIFSSLMRNASSTGLTHVCTECFCIVACHVVSSRTKFTSEIYVS